MRVLKTKQLSAFRGSWNEAFFGGREIRAFEKEWCEKFNTRFAITCNSCTTALYIACAAIGVTTNDEVLVSPFSMTVSATVPMLFGAKPIFCDIEEDNYCISFEEVKKRITNKTKAIIVVDIFGNPFDPRIYEYCKERGIFVIEDAAQAPGSKVNGEFIGKHSDLTCYSFTGGKHLSAGEGGLITTDNESLAMECRLIMNHKESCINDMQLKNDTEAFNKVNHLNPNQVGLNLRMTEIQAAIMREQLKKIDFILETKRRNCEYMEKELTKFAGITATGARENCVHSFYVQPFNFSEEIIGVSRDKFIKAFMEELRPESQRDVEGVGILVGQGYILPLFLMPLFKGEFNSDDYPVVTDLYKNKLFILRMSAPPITIENDLVHIIGAFKKVYENRSEIV